MILYHQNNVAKYVGNHIWYWPLQPLVQLHMRIGVTPGAAAGILLQLPTDMRGGYNRLSGGFSA
jgi:hypothetical protein